MSAWISATRRQPCPICGRTSWCQRTADGRIISCRTPGDGDERVDRHGARHWVYRADGSAPYCPPVGVPDRLPLAPPEVRDAVYRELIHQHLGLSDEHRADWLARGADPRRYGVRTWPDRRTGRRISRRLHDRYGEVVLGVPGIVAPGGRLGLSWGAGWVLPVPDLAGRIVALRMRRDEPGPERKKYIWVTSSLGKLYAGPSPGAHAYYAFPAGAYRHPDDLRDLGADTVRVTEGEVKAIIAAERTGVLTVSVPGVDLWRLALPILRHVRARRVLVAWDADWREKQAVARSLVALTSELRRRRLEYALEVWYDAAA